MLDNTTGRRVFFQLLLGKQFFYGIGSQTIVQKWLKIYIVFFFICYLEIWWLCADDTFGKDPATNTKCCEFNSHSGETFRVINTSGSYNLEGALI